MGFGLPIVYSQLSESFFLARPLVRNHISDTPNIGIASVLLVLVKTVVRSWSCIRYVFSINKKVVKEIYYIFAQPVTVIAIMSV